MRPFVFLLMCSVLLAEALRSNAYTLITTRRRYKEQLLDQNRTGYIVMRPYPQSRLSYYNGLNQNPIGANFLFDNKKPNRCNGKENLLEDIGSLAIFSGGVGTVIGIFSATYFSVMGNLISVISTILSFLIAIPSAIITYLATTDKLTYSIANVLSVLGFANTFYGKWSIDFGNQDIILSQVGNVIGVYSLVLSIISGFPDVFDSVLDGLKQWLGTDVVDKFIGRYRCDGKDFWGEMLSWL